MAHFNFVISQNAKWGHASFYIDCHRVTVPENILLQKKHWVRQCSGVVADTCFSLLNDCMMLLLRRSCLAAPVVWLLAASTVAACCLLSMCSYLAAVGRCCRFSSWRRRGSWRRRRRNQTPSHRGSRSSWYVLLALPALYVCVTVCLSLCPIHSAGLLLWVRRVWEIISW